MKRISLLTKILGVVAVLAVMAVFLAPDATPAYADDPYLDSNVPSSGTTDKDIALMNEHEITWLINQNQDMRDAYQLEKDFQKIIDDNNRAHGAAGSMPEALGEYDTALTVAQEVHDQAAKVIGAQYGFNAKGVVTNRAAALQTVTDARATLRDTHYRLVVMIHALHRAYAEWRHQLLGVPFP